MEWPFTSQRITPSAMKLLHDEYMKSLILDFHDFMFVTFMNTFDMGSYTGQELMGWIRDEIDYHGMRTQTEREKSDEEYIVNKRNTHFYLTCGNLEWSFQRDTHRILFK